VLHVSTNQVTGSLGAQQRQFTCENGGGNDAREAAGIVTGVSRV
jgi:hypothetical protein